MSTLKVTHLQNENGTGPAMSIAVGGGVTFAGITTFHGALDLQTPTDLRVAAGATIGGSTNTITASTNGEERVRVTSGGNVGINRVDPDQKLNVNGNIEVNAYDSPSGAGGYYTAKGLIIGNAYDAGKTANVTDDRNAIIWQERGLDLDIATSDILRMKITYDGKVGIGSNFTALEDKQGITIDSGSGGGSSGIFLKSTGYTGNQTKLWQDSANAASYLQVTERPLLIQAGNTSSHYIQFDVGGSEQASITTDGLKLASGNGINFSAYATSGNPSSNLLDDYEEGTWTPQWGSTIGAFGAITYDTNQTSGRYTKIGNRVYVDCRLKSTAVTIGSASGALLIIGLPFAVGNSEGAGGGSPSLFQIDLPGTPVNVASETRGNASQFFLLISQDNASWANVSPSALRTTQHSEVRVSFMYVI